MALTPIVDALGRIPYAEINHAADGVCRASGWHTADCAKAQQRAEAALIVFGAVAAVAVLAFVFGKR